jgi:hypothetical protein
MQIFYVMGHLISVPVLVTPLHRRALQNATISNIKGDNCKALQNYAKNSFVTDSALHAQLWQSIHTRIYTLLTFWRIFWNKLTVVPLVPVHLYSQLVLLAFSVHVRIKLCFQLLIAVHIRVKRSLSDSRFAMCLPLNLSTGRVL